MPPQSSLRGDWFSGSRHSVDIPRAHLPSGATASQFDLSGKPFSSMRHTAPSEVQPPAIGAKGGNGRGLLSRIRSGFGKAFGKNRRDKKWSEDPMSDAAYSEEVVHTKPRLDFARREAMHPDDERCIDQFVEAVRRYEIMPDGSIGRGTEGCPRVPSGPMQDFFGGLLVGSEQRAGIRWLFGSLRIQSP